MQMSLDPNKVEIIATLSPVLSLHHLSVTPVIGLIPAHIVNDLRPCPTEVDSIFTVPLYFFLEEHARHTYQVKFQVQLLSGMHERHHRHHGSQAFGCSVVELVFPVKHT